MARSLLSGDTLHCVNAQRGGCMVSPAYPIIYAVLGGVRTVVD